jgi:ribosomal subunit interface protein
MPFEPQITFRNLDSSEAIRQHIGERIAELEQVFDRIVACKVILETIHPRRQEGRMFHVTVHLSVPGGDIVVKRDPAKQHAFEDIKVAIKAAFDTTRRRLEDYVRRLGGRVKTHEAPQETGRIVRLFLDQGYGFIATSGGDEVYMHRNAVVGNGGFDSLAVGEQVRFVVHPGEGADGPQASTVIVVGKHHPQPVAPQPAAL